MHNIPRNACEVKYDWKKFSESPDLQQEYTVEVRNRFQILEDEDLTEGYQRFVEANKEAMEACVPKRVRTKRTSHSKHSDVIKARKKMEIASQKYWLR